MTVLLFVFLTIILGLTVEYFLERKKKQDEVIQPQSRNLSLSRIIQMLPKGVFLQPSFTWSKILDTGNLMLGIHPFLLEIIGEPDRVETVQQGEKIRKGETLFTIHKNDKILRVKSPVTSTVITINPDFHLVSEESMGQTWLYAMKPENVSAEIPGWFISEKSREWLNKKFQQMKGFFVQRQPQGQVGVTMADGGELPAGVLAKFDQKTWQDFEDRFMS